MTMHRRTDGGTDGPGTTDRDADCCTVSVPADRVPVDVGHPTSARQHLQLRHRYLDQRPLPRRPRTLTSPWSARPTYRTHSQCHPPRRLRPAHPRSRARKRPMKQTVQGTGLTALFASSRRTPRPEPENPKNQPLYGSASNRRMIRSTRYESMDSSRGARGRFSADTDEYDDGIIAATAERSRRQ